LQVANHLPAGESLTESGQVVVTWQKKRRVLFQYVSIFIMAHDFASIGLRRPNAQNTSENLFGMIHFGRILAEFWHEAMSCAMFLQATLMHVADTLALCRGVKEVTIYSDENCERYHTLGMQYLKDHWHMLE
jgi:hypothetical protein